MQRGTVLSFYQDVATARNVLKRLRANRIYRTTLLHRQEERIVVETHVPTLLLPIAVGAAIGGLVGLLLLLWLHNMLPMPVERAMLLGVGLLIGSLAAWRIFGVAPVDLSVFKSRLVHGESLILVFTGGQDTANILDIMRQNAGDNPVTFAFYPSARIRTDEEIEALPDGPLPKDRLAQQARDLAATHSHVQRAASGTPLQNRLRASENVIQRVRQHLAAVARVEPNILLSAEWLLDNTYIIQGQIDDFRRSLPRRYEQELPVLKELLSEESISEDPNRTGAQDQQNNPNENNKKDKNAAERELKGKQEKRGEVRQETAGEGENAGEENSNEIFEETQESRPRERDIYNLISDARAWANKYLNSEAILAVIRDPQSIHKKYQQNPPVTRVYEVARVLVAGTDARLDKENLHDFLQAYQSVTPLTIGELWAVPLMLRLRLIELLRSLAATVDQRQREREIADFWANRLLTAARRDPDQLHTFVSELVREVPVPTSHFAEQLVGHLYDEEAALAPVRDWLERRLQMSLTDAFASERTIQAREQVSLGSAISSLRELGKLDYTVLFEAVSRIDAILFSDPAGIYPNMDFATRDLYRHAIEELARRAPSPDVTEITTAFKAIELSDASGEGVGCHVGYFLIDAGRPLLESQLKSVPRFRIRFKRWTEKYGTSLYLGSVIGLSTAIIATLCLQALQAGTNAFLLIPLALLGALPASEVAVQVINYLVTRLLPPHVLPKMNFEQGVPQSFRTLVVVPMMLLTPDSIRDEIDRLEIRYLANPDQNLRYALLSDYSDAPNQHMPDDAERLDIAIAGIEQLNAKYPRSKFLLFHRERVWSASENRWMGWERKRGKLEQLNAYLMGLKEQPTSGEESLTGDAGNEQGQPRTLSSMTARAGDKESLRDIRFVITLDSDTQLPRDTGRRLVETLAHPLNQPVLKEILGVNGHNARIVERGFTILQPRVSTSLPSATASNFTRLFTDPRGTDPYTRVVSDVYQDLAGEGSYHGKGIYDLAAFQTVLEGRFPESHLLSHDLIEGAHVRVGLVSDVELFDLFPRDYVSYSSRQHRWVRGDWQIADWIGGRVPHGSGEIVPNPLSILNRWKIFDNLRRSLLPAAGMLLLILAWLFAPGATPVQWSWLVAWMFLCPAALQLLGHVTRRWQRDPMMWQELGTTLIRAALFLAIMPHQAWLNMDAIVRVLYRKQLTHRLMLEWETASEAHRRSRDKRKVFARTMAIVAFASLGLGAAVLTLRPDALLAASPFLLLWLSSPMAIALLNREVKRDTASRLTESDRLLARQIARQTWRFFDDFVGPQTNWLSPDNYQSDLRVEIAPRTSPTNIGLGLLAFLAAQDMGFITLDDAIERAHATLEVLSGLETHEGHLFNWYDIYSQKALVPRYVSFVDSGNFLGDLWTLVQGVEARLEAPLLETSSLRGLADTLTLLQQSFASPMPDLESLRILQTLSHLPGNRPAPNVNDKNVNDKSGGSAGSTKSMEGLIRAWRSARKPAQELLDVVRNHQDSVTRAQNVEGEDPEKDALAALMPQAVAAQSPVTYWAGKIQQQVEAWNMLIDRYFAWVEALMDAPPELLITLGQDAHEWRRQALSSAPSLRTLGSDHIAGLSALTTATDRLDRDKLDDVEKAWLDRLQASHQQAQWFAGEKLAQAQEMLDRTQTLADNMNMRFLYDVERRSFSIGYNVEERRIDSFYYDLLASEARLGSFVAVARGDVPVEHWFALGRPFTLAYGQRVLLSWNGTMFEYLMPLLLTRHYENSLLDQGCRAAVRCQITYGKRRGIPWGISEAAYSALDTRQIYQYRAFGVPGLGLKRGLENDLVVAPYATALSLTLAPTESLHNLRQLAKRGLKGDYGFYESIDYTRQADQTGDRGVIVKTYMAHHQGMSLLAIDNLLNDNIMQNRFHSDPRVRATESLLYERVPANPPLAKDYAAQVSRTRVTATPQTTAPTRIPTPDTQTPRTHLLANAEYSVMITNAGGGVSKWKDLEISRWRADTTRDNSGTFIYIKDLDDNAFWSATAQPIGGNPRSYMALFTPEKAEFSRRDADITTQTEIVVSPEDNVEIRRLTLVNHSDRERHLELTSYVEIALAAHAADRAHPAFSKLFVQTESLPEHSALLASRRPRSADDPTLWAVHVVAMPAESEEWGQCETDRARFLGRNGSPARPEALYKNLTGSVGAVLDPIFSLRRRLTLAPGERIEIKFMTGAGESREVVVALAEKYSQLQAANRAVELAWTYAQLDLRHLRLQPDEAMRYQQLASYVLYPSAFLRANEDRLKRNRLAQPSLWAHGISGDLPIVVLTIGDVDDIDVAQQLIIAHNFWRTRGLKCDLVILNDEAASYDQPLQDQLRRLIQAYAQTTGADQPGGVFLRPSRDIPEEDLTLILTVARVAMVAARGNLAQQLGNLAPQRPLPAAFRAQNARRQVPGDRGEDSTTSSAAANARNFGEEPSAPLPFLELPYFNGTGGFTEDGKEYIIYMGPGTQTPLPWINVMANPLFGTIVSESGRGYSWYGNSQSNRLTPWSNDPVLDPLGEAIYIRDEDLGVLWTPTPRPIREQDAYRAHHGQGYSSWEHNSHAIEQELLTFVPVDDNGGSPVRIQRLRLRNASSHTRRLTITSFVEWTLGVEREDTQMHVVTEWDKGSQSLFARNAYQPDFGSRVAFTTSQPPASSYTGDRAEFLGRNGSASSPAALRRVKLSNRVGAGTDPCGALQVTIEIAPGQQTEVLFVLGQGSDANEARALATRFHNPAEVDQALRTTQQWWDKTLDVVQVDTPELSVNFLLNRWLLYQDLSCRLWGRSAFYQSGGAFGFRDQLQDIMAILYAHPSFAREQILRSAARQFVEGDVQHWWHPPSGAGVRTRISDDLLWLPYVTAQYVRVTGDTAILDVTVPFLDGTPLGEKEHEMFNVPTVSKEQATLLEHCRRALHKGTTAGPHGLPLMGAGDWNDGLNRVGAEGKGESVWLAWFLVHVLNDFAYLLRQSSGGKQELSGNQEKSADPKAGGKKSKSSIKNKNDISAAGVPANVEVSEADACETLAKQLAATIEATTWDGAWYLRAFFDDGTPLGSAQNEEMKIDSLPQSWSVISGMGDPERSTHALQAVEEYLVKDNTNKADNQGDNGSVLLFTPAFDKTPHDPGYIKGYVPGVRENGGQYTHGSLWMPLAYAMRGEGGKACRLLRIMNPIEHAREPQGVMHYKVEPYVAVADIYSLKGQEGRGGWTWYTGSAGWMYRVWIESVLGLRKRGETLTLDPSIPAEWDGFTMRYRHGGSLYTIRVENPTHVEHGVGLLQLDGVTLDDKLVSLQDDGKEHAVRVVLGPNSSHDAADPAAPVVPAPAESIAPVPDKAIARLPIEGTSAELAEEPSSEPAEKVPAAPSIAGPVEPAPNEAVEEPSIETVKTATEKTDSAAPP